MTLAPGTSLRVPVTGLDGVPSSGVTAVALNVTATDTSASGYFTVFNHDDGRPTASNLNFVKGATVPNLVISAVAGDGTVDIYDAGGTADVVVDLFGWYDGDQSTNAGRFEAVAPWRDLDTRTHLGPVPAGSADGLAVTGVGGVPSTNVAGVVLNVTVTAPAGSGFLTVFPADASDRPEVSNLNYVAGQTVPNLVVSGVSSMASAAGPAGSIALFAGVNATQVVVDVAGYFTGPAYPTG